MYSPIVKDSIFSLFELIISKKVAISLKDDTSIPQKSVSRFLNNFDGHIVYPIGGFQCHQVSDGLFITINTKIRYNAQFYLQEFVKNTYFWVAIQNTFGTAMCNFLVPNLCGGCGVSPCSHLPLCRDSTPLGATRKGWGCLQKCFEKTRLPCLLLVYGVKKPLIYKAFLGVTGDCLCNYGGLFV